MASYSKPTSAGLAIAGLIFAAGMWTGWLLNEHGMARQKLTPDHRVGDLSNREQSSEAEHRQEAAIDVSIFNADDSVAAELVREFEAVRRNHQALVSDPDPDNDPKDLIEYYTKSLGTRAERNPVLKRWLGDRPGSFIGDRLWGKTAARRREKGALPPFLLEGRYSGAGTGFFVSSDGWLVTNQHVVGNHREVDIRGIDGFITTARVAKTDSAADLALIKSDSPTAGSLDIISGNLPLGTRVFTIGFPNATTQGVQAKFTEGSISSLAGLRDDPNDYQVSVPLHPGNSGGALVDMNTGLVAGVVTSSLSPGLTDNVGYAIKAGPLLKLILSVPETATISPHTSTGTSTDRTTAIDRATRATVMVLVK